MLQIFRPAPSSSWNWIALKGPDAADFLHRLTTIHVKALQPGQGAPGFFLTAQGKVRAYFHLWMISREEFFFEVDPGTSGKWKQELLSVIDQFHFGEKITIDTGEKPELEVAWLFGSASEIEDLDELKGLSAQRSVQTSSGLSAFHHGEKDFGTSWISVWAVPHVLSDWLGSIQATSLSPEKVEAMRIHAARPRLDHELNENSIPLEAGLRDAISDNKGCYPGQEVIERIISLGSPTRRLARIQGSGKAPQVGETVKTADGTQEIGAITSVTQTADGFEALAYVKKMHAKEGLEISLPSSSSARLVTITPFA